MQRLRSAVRGAAILTVLASIATWSIPATAAAEQQLQVSPTKTQLQGEAGATLTANITITAPESGIRVTYQHADFGFDDDYQVVLIPDSAKETTSFSTRRWFTVAPPEFTLKASATRTIPVKIEIPGNTPSGTYMGAAIFAVAPSDDAAGGQIQANVSIASLIFVSVAGGDPPKAKIRSFDVPRLVTRGSFTPQLVVDNTGTLGFTADGSIEVDGKDALPEQTYAPQYVQPDKPRTLRVQSAKKKNARVDTRKLGIGRHEVTLRLRIDPTNQTLVVEKTFWVIPMWLRVLVGVGLLVLVLGGVWIGMKIRQRVLIRRLLAAEAAGEITPIPPAVPAADAQDTDAPDEDPVADPEPDPATEAEADDDVYEDFEEDLAYDDEDDSYDDDLVYEDDLDADADDEDDLSADR